MDINSVEEEDPLRISDWCEFRKRCIAQGKKEVFLQAMDLHILVTHAPIKKDILAYVMNLHMEDKLEKQREALHQAKIERQKRMEEKAIKEYLERKKENERIRMTVKRV